MGDFGTARHFLLSMLLAAFAGAILGTGAELWNWSSGVRLGVMTLLILGVGLFTTREVVFAPAKRPATRTPRRGSELG